MMFLLPRDVGGHLLSFGFADTECAVPALPRELAHHFADLFRGVTLQILNYLRKRDGGRQGQQDVQMIPCSPNRKD